MRQIRSFVIQVIAQIRHLKGLASGHFLHGGDIVEFTFLKESTPLPDNKKRFQAISIGLIRVPFPEMMGTCEEYLLEGLPAELADAHVARRFHRVGEPELYLYQPGAGGKDAGKFFEVSIRLIRRGDEKKKKNARRLRLKHNEKSRPILRAA